jgi:predicted nucleic acid-binding protein
MDNIVVDANILFAALISNNRKTRLILANHQYKFYAPKYLFVELFEHKETILQKAHISEAEVYELLDNILQNIHFVGNDFISTTLYWQAYRLCKDADEDDTPFVALALALKAKYWTRDETLKTHLRTQGFNDFFEPNY